MKEILAASIGLGIIGLFFSIVLSFAYQKLKVTSDPRLQEILDILPGINCGACGFSGCRSFAEAVLKENDIFSGCLAGGKEVNSKILSILGKEQPLHTSHKKAILLCNQPQSTRIYSSQYIGPSSCRLANLTSGGLSCRWGCLGFGDCVQACKFGALKMVDGLPQVDYQKCVGCGACVEACPRNLFILIDVDNLKYFYAVACSNPQNASQTKQVCQKGCIGCSLCTRIIKDSPFNMKGSLAYLDYKKYKGQNLDLALEKCPSGVIKKFEI